MLLRINVRVSCVGRLVRSALIWISEDIMSLVDKDFLKWYWDTYFSYHSSGERWTGAAFFEVILIHIFGIVVRVNGRGAMYLWYCRCPTSEYPNAAHPNRHGSLVMLLVTDDRSGGKKERGGRERIQFVTNFFPLCNGRYWNIFFGKDGISTLF